MYVKNHFRTCIPIPVLKNQISHPYLSGLLMVPGSFNKYYQLPLPTWHLHDGHLPTYINTAALIEKEPCHLLAVKPDVVLHVPHWGFLPNGSIS